MRAGAFFKVLKKGKEIHAREKNSLVASICDAATIPLNFKNYETFGKYYREMAYGKPKRRALDLKDDKTAAIIASAFWSSSPIRRNK